MTEIEPDMNYELESRRLEVDAGLRQAELEEKAAQRLSEDKRHQIDAELRRLEIESSSGKGISFTSQQATVIAAVIAVVSAALGGGIQGYWSNRSGLELEKQKFASSLVAKATADPDRNKQIRNLQFYAAAGFIEEPYASKILAMKPEQYPSSVPLPASQPIPSPTTAQLLATLGTPSQHLQSWVCGKLENKSLSSLLGTDSIGPLKVTLLKPALVSLKAIFAEIAKTQPDLIQGASNLGTLCVRTTRPAPGGSGRLSAHAFGTAIDIAFGHKGPSLWDNASQSRAAPFFERAGWTWGGRWKQPDPIHFEVGGSLIASWAASGKLIPHQ
jgi:hypothetical protein